MLSTSSFVEFALNSALKMDPQSRQKLSDIDGISVCISLDNFSPWIFIVENGELRTCSKKETECELRLSGNLSGFLDLFRKDDDKKTENKNARLYIEGDLRAAQKFQQAMSRLKPDFDELLREKLGDKFGKAASDVLYGVKNQGDKIKNTAQSSLDSWLSGLNSPFITRREFDAFSVTVTLLNDRISKLEAKMSSFL